MRQDVCAVESAQLLAELPAAEKGTRCGDHHAGEKERLHVFGQLPFLDEAHAETDRHADRGIGAQDDDQLARSRPGATYPAELDEADVEPLEQEAEGRVLAELQRKIGIPICSRSTRSWPTADTAVNVAAPISVVATPPRVTPSKVNAPSSPRVTTMATMAIARRFQNSRRRASLNSRSAVSLISLHSASSVVFQTGNIAGRLAYVGFATCCLTALMMTKAIFHHRWWSS